MDSLNKLLQDRNWDEPDEAKAIKSYIREKFKADTSVQVRGNDLIVSAPSAALVTSLRYDIVNLRRVVNTKKQLVFRIGG